MSDASDRCEVVRIHAEKTKGNPDGITEINKSDYVAGVHKLVDEAAPELPLAAAELVVETAPSPQETADKLSPAPGPFAPPAAQ